MATLDLTQHRLRELLDYSPETGLFIRKKWTGGTGRAGTVAGGSHGKTGYRQISVDGHLYFAHRLAWFWHYGVWPAHVIDHINGNPSDNRIANLRDVPHEVNCQNKRRRKKDGDQSLPLGVTRHHRRFVAQVSGHYVGLFKTAEDAHAAYIEAKRKMHAGCTL